MIRKLLNDDLEEVLSILRQDTLRYADGHYPEKGWISHFLTDERCVALGLFDNEALVSVLIFEKLSYEGCMLWYLAVRPDLQGKGYGRALLEDFEKNATSYNINWVFLNATSASLSFYKKSGYVTSEHSKVWEHYKELT